MTDGCRPRGTACESRTRVLVAVRPWPAVGVLLVIVVLTAAVGCGRRGPPRYRVEGSVTFAGQPVPWGAVTFAADASRGNVGPGAFAMIADGRYETTREQGVVGGPTQVRVSGFDGSPGAEGIPGNGKPLFPDWETTVDLPRADQTFDIVVPDPGD